MSSRGPHVSWFQYTWPAVSPRFAQSTPHIFGSFSSKKRPIVAQLGLGHRSMIAPAAASRLLRMLLLLLFTGGVGAAWTATSEEGPGAACSPPDLPMRGNQIEAPRRFDSASIAAWLQKMRQMRADCQRSIGFNGSMFRVPELEWTQTAYVSVPCIDAHCCCSLPGCTRLWFTS
jgi:hypothetical protein